MSNTQCIGIFLRISILMLTFFPLLGQDNETMIVGLKTILDKINLPTVIKTEILPGDQEESIFIITQPGELWLIRKNNPQKILDISPKGRKLVHKLGNIPGASDKTYDERGLLGIEFHPDFTQNGRFFLYYSAQNHSHKLVAPPLADPCNHKTLNVQWLNHKRYDHTNVVEEWHFKNMHSLKRIKRFLTIKHPFFNHNSINNIYWSRDLNKLLLLTGDGGHRDGPFNLSQDDRYFHGKLIELDVDAPAWTSYTSKPVARFDELPLKIRNATKVLIKGVRNWSGITEFLRNNTSIKFVGQPGQDNVEAVYAFKDFTEADKNGNEKPLNFGWHAWEGSWPTVHFLNCRTKKFSTASSRLMNPIYYDEAVYLDVERRLPYCQYFHLDKRPGKVQSRCISGQQVYRGDTLPALKNQLIISDWSFNTTGLVFPDYAIEKNGFLICVSIDDQLEKLHDYKRIDIAYSFNKPAFFVSLGADKNNTRIFLGTYQTVGTTTANLGTVYELVPA